MVAGTVTADTLLPAAAGLKRAAITGATGAGVGNGHERACSPRPVTGADRRCEERLWAVRWVCFTGGLSVDDNYWELVMVGTRKLEFEIYGVSALVAAVNILGLASTGVLGSSARER